LDRIILEGIQFYGYHGRNNEERVLGQPFEVYLEAELDLTAAGVSDDIADSVSYTDLYRVAKRHVEGPGRNLVEAVAHAIASEILDTYLVESVRVRVIKVRPPIKGGVLAGAGVEVFRRRAGEEQAL
jgi:dihydroneopterin aldolase